MHDILFGNNNQTVLKWLAKADLRCHRLKTSVTATIIVMATCLLAVIGIVLVNDGLAKTDSMPYHVQYRAVTEEMKEKLQADPDFEAVGLYKDFGSKMGNDGRINLAYMDDTAMSLLGFQLLDGRIPAGAQEVLVSKTYSDFHQLSPGNAFDFAYTDILTNQPRTQHFVVCGIMEHRLQEAGKQFYIISSNQFRTTYAQQAGSMTTSEFSTQTPDSVDLLLRLCAEQKRMGVDETEAYLKSKGLALGLQSYDIVLNIGYIKGFMLDSTVLAGMICFAAFLMFASGFVIYSVFQISITASMPMYAQLMSLGTTHKQLRRFLQIQGNVLALRFIPLGMLLALLLSVLITEMVLFSGFKWILYDILLILFSGLLIFAAIKIALHKPAALLASVSPIEAMHYAGETEKKGHRQLQQITPVTLAENNLRINRKKNRMAIFSLSLSGMLMIACITLLSSLNLPAMLMQSYPLNESFQVGIQMDNFYDRFPQVIQDNPLSETLEAEIAAIAGVEKIIKDECVIGNLLEPAIAYETPNDNQELINSLSPELLENVSEVVQGSIAYEDLGESGIIINKYRTDSSKLNYDEIQAGDTLLFQFVQNDTVYERTFQVTGIAYFPSTGLFYTTPEIIRAISPYRNVSHLSIFCKAENAEAVQEELQKMINQNPNLRLNVYTEELSEVGGYMQMMTRALYGVSVFVILFGILHMANMLISSAIVRKKEFALLQAVGMTTKQLGQMLRREGLEISVKAAVIAAFCGVLLGNWFCYLANKVLALKFIVFSWNLWPVLLFTVVLIGLQSLISYGICKLLVKDTITERLQVD